MDNRVKLTLLFILGIDFFAFSQKSPVVNAIDTNLHIKNSSLSEVSIAAKGPRLPNKQKNSVRIPDDLRIDGETTEWNGGFQAYNRTTEVYYTIANSDDKLYLLIHAIKHAIIEKIMEGGVSFTITGLGDKHNDREAVALFPLISIENCKNVLQYSGKPISGEIGFSGASQLFSGKRELTKADYDLITKQTDLQKANELLSTYQREIKVSGMPDVIDTIDKKDITSGRKFSYYQSLPLRRHGFKIIGISNNDGINATTQFNDKGTYTYELLLPLDRLGVNINSLKKINYTITLNARGDDGRVGNIWMNAIYPPHQRMYLDLETPTEFSGEYTLAK